MKKIKIVDIILFESLLDFKLDNHTIDIHNQYNCKRIHYNENVLIFDFTDNNELLRLTFLDVDIRRMNFPFKTESDYITLDNMYRGRFESNNKLEEVTLDSKGYIYIDFYEGQSLEFFCSELDIDLV